MPNHMPKVYEGDLDYIFVSYAHRDRRTVLPIIRALVAEGHRVWYDDGIELATNYPDYIADHVYGCALFLMFVSRNSNASQWCTDEANYALDLRKTILPVYLEDVELRRGLRMRLGSRQSIFCTAFPSRDEFCRELFGAEVVRACLTSEAASRYGADPWGEFAAGDVQTARSQATRKRPKGKSPVEVGGVVRRAALAEYSWAELKVLSRRIAQAGSNAEWLQIAKAYSLVDEDGRLQGATKPLKLKDGVDTSVRILGFRHDELAGGGRAGISFEFADVPAAHRMNPSWTNDGGWERSEMRRWLNGEFLDRLPVDLRPLVEVASKRTNNIGELKIENDTSVVSATGDRLWLLSMSEVYGQLSTQTKNVPWSPATYDAEGTQYQLYADKGVSSTSYASCIKRGSGGRMRGGGFARRAPSTRAGSSTSTSSVAGSTGTPMATTACPPASASSHPGSCIVLAPCGKRVRS